MMHELKAQALIVTCIDYRFQKYISDWISSNLPDTFFDRVSLAGGVKELEIILTQIDISVSLHHIKKVILINHEDCGAYGEIRTQGKQTEDLKKAKDKINNLFPNLEVETYYLHLNADFEQIT